MVWGNLSYIFGCDYIRIKTQGIQNLWNSILFASAQQHIRSHLNYGTSGKLNYTSSCNNYEKTFETLVMSII
jgi:hypothetical protein